MCVVEISVLCDCFSVCNLRSTSRNFTVVFSSHSFYVNVQVQLTHTFDDCFVAFWIYISLECRVFFCESVQSLWHLVCSFLVFWCDRKRDNRIRYEHRSHSVVCSRTTECISRSTVNTEQSYDVSWATFVDIFHACTVHSNKSSNLELLACTSIVKFFTLLECSLIYTNVCQLTILTVFKFESECNTWVFFVRRKCNRGFVVVQIQSCVFNFCWVRKEFNNTVEQWLNTLVLVSWTQENRNELFCQSSLSDSSINHIFWRFTFEHSFHQFIAEHWSCVQKFFSVFVCFVNEVCWNFSIAKFCSAVAFEVDSFHRNQVYYTFKFVFQTNRDFHHVCVESEFFAQLHSYFEWVSTCSVTFVYESDSRNVISFKLSVNSDWLRLNTTYRTENQNSSIKYSKWSFNFNCKVNVAWSINYVDSCVFPFYLCWCRLDCNSSFSFQFHVIHNSTNTIFSSNFMDCVDFVAIEQNSLRQSCLSWVNVGADTDISEFRNIHAHMYLSKKLISYR